MTETPPQTLKQMCTPGEILHDAGVPLATVQTYAAKGRFVAPIADRDGNARLYDPAAVAAWIEARPRRLRLHDVIEDTEWLADSGETWDQALTRIGATNNALTRALQRAGRRDLIVRLKRQQAT